MTQGGLDYVAFISVASNTVKIRLPKPLEIVDGRPLLPKRSLLYGKFRTAGLDVLETVAGRILPLDLSSL